MNNFQRLTHDERSGNRPRVSREAAGMDSMRMNNRCVHLSTQSPVVHTNQTLLLYAFLHSEVLVQSSSATYYRLCIQVDVCGSLQDNKLPCSHGESYVLMGRSMTNEAICE